MAKIGDKATQSSVDYRGLEVPDAPEGKGHTRQDVNERAPAGHERSVPVPTDADSGHAGKSTPASRVLTELLAGWSPDLVDCSGLRASGRAVGAGPIRGIERIEGALHVRGENSAADLRVTPAFLPDGKSVLVANVQGTIAVVRTGDMEVLAEQELGEWVQSSPAVVPGGRFALIATRAKETSGVDGTLRSVELGSTAGISPAGEFPLPERTYSSPSVSANGRVAVVGCDDGTLYSVRIARDGSLEEADALHLGGKVRTSPTFTSATSATTDGQYVVVGTDDGKTHAVQVDADGSLQRISTVDVGMPLGSGATQVPGTDIFLVSTGLGDSVCALRLDEGGGLHIVDQFAAGREVNGSVAVNQDGTMAAIFSGDRSVYTLHIEPSGKLRFADSAFYGWPTSGSPVFSSDGKRLLVPGDRGRLRLFDVGVDGGLSEAFTRQFRNRELHATPLVSPSGSVLLAASDARIYSLGPPVAGDEP